MVSPARISLIFTLLLAATTLPAQEAQPTTQPTTKEAKAEKKAEKQAAEQAKAEAKEAKAEAKADAKAAAKAPKHKSIKSVDLGDGVTIDLVYIKPGTFTIGSTKKEQEQSMKEGALPEWVSDENEMTKVTLTEGFWMGKTEVTNAQWNAVMDESPSEFEGDDIPVNAVSWNAAKEFVSVLAEKTGLDVALPTEAQWEYACRAGTKSAFSFGNPDKADEFAWFDYNSDAQPHPVASKKPNPWGLHDMHGNQWEWCEDYYSMRYPGGEVTDPTGAEWDRYKVARSGSWVTERTFLRSANRYGYDLGFKEPYMGVRIVAND